MAFIDDARKSFESLEKILHQENILNHFLFKISHDESEAILQTIEDQKIILVITDFDTYGNNKELQTLVTCPVLAIIEKATDDDITTYESTDVNIVPNISSNTTSNNASQQSNQTKIKVVASFYPIYEFVKAVGGDRIDASVLYPLV
ncbi:MAG: hypothetical protein WA667_07265 [Candidatus Nitrosopolaris sp.]